MRRLNQGARLRKTEEKMKWHTAAFGVEVREEVGRWYAGKVEGHSTETIQECAGKCGRLIREVGV